jgi:hypothetical protein
LLKSEVPSSFYDLFLMGKAENRATDLVMADFAKPDPERSILTLYRPMPIDGMRSALMAESAYADARKEFETQIAEEVLPLFGMDEGRVADLRLTRWGHALPIADKGRIADGTVDWLRKPFRERLFFVEQDNWCLPAIETSAEEALHFAPLVAKLLA